MRNSRDLQKYDFSTSAGRRQAWVEILQSGTYQQANGVLKFPATNQEPAKFCCLGVACDIFHRVTGEGMWNGKEFFIFYLHQFSETYLPVAVAEWFGLDHDPGVQETDVGQVITETRRSSILFEHYCDNNRGVRATSLNDDFRLTLQEIGRIFEARFKREAEAITGLVSETFEPLGVHDVRPLPDSES